MWGSIYVSTFCTNNIVEDFNIENIKNKLKTELSQKRFIHSLNVMETAIKLASKYLPDDIERVAVAALLHDLARDLSIEEMLKICNKYNIEYDDTMLHPALLHASVGAEIAKIHYGINDPDIISAIRFHTVAKEDMTIMEKIVFIADYIEPGRSYPEADIVREISEHNIDKAVLTILNQTINYLILKGSLIHINAVNARNFLIKELVMTGGVS